jgi:copper homeostasis protein CutC
MTNSLSKYALNQWSRQWLPNEAAKRLELRGRLLDGGITPCSGLIATIRLTVSIGLRVMICPAEAVLLYPSRVCRLAALMAKHLGMDGVVLGILDENGEVDIAPPRVNSLPLAGRRNRIGRRPDFDFRVRADGSRGCRDDSEPGGGSAGEVITLSCGGIDAQDGRAVVEQAGVRGIHVGLRSFAPSEREHFPGDRERRCVPRFEVSEHKVESLVRAPSAPAVGNG